MSAESKARSAMGKKCLWSKLYNYICVKAIQNALYRQWLYFLIITEYD